MLSNIRLKKYRSLINNLRYFCKEAPLKIKTKDGEIVTLRLNKAQEYIHSKLEEQLRLTGKVRALILKGRQQGASTYVSARYYHKTSTQRGKNTYILTHEAEATENLFSMVENYYDESSPAMRPTWDTKNNKKFRFNKLKSQYQVGTAGNKKTGRSGTNHYFHGSEVAFWEHTDSIQTGALQTVGDVDGTEIILESTANGMGNFFHAEVSKAIEGEGEYILIFVPWFWQDEYEADVPDDFILTKEETEYKESYKELTDRKMMWRRKKIRSFDKKNKGSGAWKFKQEYPANPIEAFQTSGDSLISSEDIMRARKCTKTDPDAPVVIGGDPAKNKDRWALVARRGREIIRYQTWTVMKPMRFAGIVAGWIDDLDAQVTYIDVAEGSGPVDRLHEMGYDDVRAVHFGEAAIEEDRFINKRVEMWTALRDWVQERDVNIPDDDDFHQDLTCVPDSVQTSGGKYKLIPKDIIRRDFGKSTDIGDAASLTFAYPVISPKRRNRIRKAENTGKRGGGGITTMRRRRQRSGNW